jgi:hypothetical protein
VTRLRKMMLDELQLRNYAQNTVRAYVRIVERLRSTSVAPRNGWVRRIFASTRFIFFATCICRPAPWNSMSPRCASCT